MPQANLMRLRLRVHKLLGVHLLHLGLRRQLAAVLKRIVGIEDLVTHGQVVPIVPVVPGLIETAVEIIDLRLELGDAGDQRGVLFVLPIALPAERGVLDDPRIQRLRERLAR